MSAVPATPPAQAQPGSRRASRLDEGIVRWGRLRRHPWHGHALALALFAAALAARFAVAGWLPPGFPFLTFFPAIVVSAFLAGRGPGVLCSVLSIVSAWYWFVPPAGSFELDGPSAVAVGFFVVIAAVDVFVIDTVLRTHEALMSERRTTEALLEQQGTLFHELQHRVANNMAMVAAVLSAQQRRLAHNPEAVEALVEARRRFNGMSSIHRRLHDPAMSAQQYSDYLRALCRDSVDASGAGVPIDVDVVVDDTGLGLDLNERITVAMLVVELITNAIKHAFDGRRPARLSVALGAAADGAYELVVADNGRGLPPDFDPARSDRLGMKIVNGLVKSIRGTLRLETGDGGSRFIVSVPGGSG